MWLQPEINMFIYLPGCTMLQPITMQESVWAWSTSCGVIVYCRTHYRASSVYCYFHVFRLINKGSLLFAGLLLFNYVNFIRYETWITQIKIWQNYNLTGWLTGFLAVPSQSQSQHVARSSQGHTRSSIYIIFSTNNRSFFQYASPRLWNQLPAFLHQTRTNLSNSASPSSLIEWHFLHQLHRFNTLTIHHPFTLLV